MNSIAQRAGTVSAKLEVATRAQEFGATCRIFALAKGDRLTATAIAEAQHLGSVAEYFKAPIAPLGTGDGLVQAPPTAAAFLASLRTIGAFDRIAVDAKHAPPNSRIVAITAGASANLHGEAQVKPLTSLSMVSFTMAASTAVAVFAVSDEVLKFGGGQYFQGELAAAVAKFTDEKFISLVTAGLTPLPSAGATSNQILQDVARLLAAIDTDAASRVFIIAQPATLKAMATKTTANTGDLAFPTLTINGGTLAGVTFIASDGVANGTMVAVDGNAIAVDTGTATPGILTQASLQFQTTPDSPSTAATLLMNLWQNGLKALAVHRTFGAQLLRPTGAAMVDGVNYQTGNSPA